MWGCSDRHDHALAIRLDRVHQSPASALEPAARRLSPISRVLFKPVPAPRVQTSILADGRKAVLHHTHTGSTLSPGEEPNASCVAWCCEASVACQRLRGGSDSRAWRGSRLKLHRSPSHWYMRTPGGHKLLFSRLDVVGAVGACTPTRSRCLSHSHSRP